MNSSLILPVLLATLAVSPAFADEASETYESCISTSYLDIPIHIVPRFDAPTYDYQAGVRDITAMSSDSHHSIHESLTLGLTRYEPMLSISAPIVGVKKSNGQTCSHVQQVNITLGYQDVVVYIGREIQQGTCGFEEVMAHEQKHIDVNMQLLQEYIPRISSELNEFLKSNGASQDPNVDQSMNGIKAKLQSIVEGLFKEMEQDNQARQQEVDTPEEYARISSSCNGELRDIAQEFRQNHH